MLAEAHRQKITDVIKTCLRNKFKNYNPETKQMPFHFRLLGRDRMALYSFIQSLNTAFGSSVFEPVSEILAESRFKSVQKQFIVGNEISEIAQAEIQDIINELTTGGNPDKPKEIARIRKVCRMGNMNKLKPVKADLFAQDRNGTVHLFELKTAKPNIPGFKDFKRTLLEWVAIFLAAEPRAEVNSYIAIPYNPYEPKPYERWTIRGMLDLDYELKVAEEFWNFLYGGNVYSDLLDCFEKAGIELKPEIDAYFSRFR